MSRRRKTRRLKDKLSIKTGSKKDFIPRGQKGRIASRNTLAKHRRRQKSAFEKHIEQRQLKNTAGAPTASDESEHISEDSDR